MTKLFSRIVVLLLVPCLVADPAWSKGEGRKADCTSFQTQALAVPSGMTNLPDAAASIQLAKEISAKVRSTGVPDRLLASQIDIIM
jgi:hypothetical protein